MKKIAKKVGTFLIAMGVGGYFGGYLIGKNNFNLSVIDWMTFLFALIISYVLHIVIHEAGHGIFG